MLEPNKHFQRRTISKFCHFYPRPTLPFSDASWQPCFLTNQYGSPKKYSCHIILKLDKHFWAEEFYSLFHFWCMFLNNQYGLDILIEVQRVTQWTILPNYFGIRPINAFRAGQQIKHLMPLDGHVFRTILLDNLVEGSLTLSLIRQFCSRRLWTYFVKK